MNQMGQELWVKYMIKFYLANLKLKTVYLWAIPDKFMEI